MRTEPHTETLHSESTICLECPLLSLRVNSRRTAELGQVVREVCENEDLTGELPNAALEPEKFFEEAEELAKKLGAHAEIPIVAGTNEIKAVLECVLTPSCSGDINNERVHDGC